MNIGGLKELQSALGGRIGLTYCCALKKAAGINSRKFDLSRAIKWLKENPDFKVSDAFPSQLRRGTRKDRRRGVSVDKSHEQP